VARNHGGFLRGGRVGVDHNAYRRDLFNPGQVLHMSYKFIFN
jgi:hypothetical protein